MKRILALLAALVLLAPMVCTAAADRTGSIAIRMTHQGEPVSGGSITLFCLAELSAEYRFVPRPEWTDCGVDLNGELTAENAERLEQYALQKGIPGRTLDLGQEGTAVFSGLEGGLYLLCQREAGEGYLPVRPFLCAVPLAVDGELCYDVQAGPKCAPEPTDQKGTVIPQTGQLNWPVPVLGLLGAALTAAGCLLRGRREHDET